MHQVSQNDHPFNIHRFINTTSADAKMHTSQKSYNIITFWKQIDIIISNNQALQILYLKHCVYKQQHNLNYHG